LALAVDKERITKRITRAGEQPAESLVPPGTQNYQPPPGLGHDPERARKLLAEAGYPGGKGFPRFEYLFNASPIHEKIAVELQQMWRDELGIEMELRQVETQVFWGMQQRLEYQMSKSSWAGDYNDANTFLGMFVAGGGNNETGWSNPRYDELIAAANNELDTAKREKLFQQAETILVHDDVPVIPLYVYLGINYFDTNKVTGIWPNLLDNHPLQSVHKIKPTK